MNENPVSESSIPFESIDKQIEILQVQKNLLLDKAIRSDDPNSIIKAKEYLSLQEKSSGTGFKSYLFSPEKEFYNGMGYKNTMKSITYDLMRKMSYTPAVNSIITTRVNQVMNFAVFTMDLQKEGWTIRKKPDRFPDENNDKKKISNEEKKVIDYIATFLENGGLLQKWEQSDDFDDYLRKQVIDSLTFDQATFEVERSRNGKPYSYISVDAATVRLLETIDPDLRKEQAFNIDNYKKINGKLPTYAQVYNGRIVERDLGAGLKEQVVFYPHELNFGIRNKTTDIRQNGYGKSELEILVDIVSYQLFGMHYNGNFFRQGSNPKGFFSIDGNVQPEALNEFRQAWRNQVAGFQNSHKVPVFESKGAKIQWNDMQSSNKDMEFQNWNDFLILLTCSVYKIDPSELGFNFQKQSQMFGQDGQHERLTHSRDKGLIPLLIFLQQRINKHIVSEINDQYEFIWTGVDLENESEILENDIKKSGAGFVAHADMFKKYSGRDFNPDKDTILNNVYLQAQQSKQFGGEESNQAVDEMTGEPEAGAQNPFAGYEKAETDPFMKSLNAYVEKTLKSY